MEKIIKVISMLLDGLKKVLVRFKNAKFGLLFIINIFKIPDFMTDSRVSIISKLKVVFSFAIDFIPEMITGVFGMFDDLLILVWCLGIMSEEIEKYKDIIKNSKDLNIIEDVDFEIKDEK